MSYIATPLTAEEQAKIPTPGYVPLTWDELILATTADLADRPRVYGYIEPLEGEPHGQIVKLASSYYVERYEGRLSFAWMSGTTIADLVGRG